MLLVRKADGSEAVEHADGTRISRRYQDGETVVSVERDACATVLMFPERRTAQVLLADGTVVTATTQGTYQASPASGSGSESERGPDSPASAPSGASGQRREPGGGQRRDVHVRGRRASGGRRARLQDEPHGRGGLRGHGLGGKPLPGHSGLLNARQRPGSDQVM